MPKKPTLNKSIRIVENASMPSQTRFWNWSPRAEADEDAEIQFYGYISEYSWYGDSITPVKFAEDLAKYGDGGPITVRIHSGGGDMLAASAIRAMLSDYAGRVTSRIDGVCASAAVAVALAGDEIIIQDSAYMLIHNPGYVMLLGWLDAEVLRELSTDLDKFAESLVAIYATRTGLTEDQIGEMMALGDWMTAEEAVTLGFADSVATGGVAAKTNTSVQNLIENCANLPDGLCAVEAVVNDEHAEQLRSRVQTILRPDPWGGHR